MPYSNAPVLLQSFRDRLDMRRPFCGGLSAAGRWLLPTDAAVQTKDDAGATSRAPHSVGDRVEGGGSLNPRPWRTTAPICGR